MRRSRWQQGFGFAVLVVAALPWAKALASDAAAARFVNGNVPLPALQALSIPWKRAYGTPEFIVFGNRRYGYFKTERFQWEHGSLSADVTAPGYGAPLENYGCRQVGDKRVCHPGPSRLPSPPREFHPTFPYHLTLQGHPSWRFILLTGHLLFRDCEGSESCEANCQVAGKTILPDELTAPFAYILNREGEMVWAHILPKKKSLAVWNSTLAKPLAGGRIGVLQPRGDCHYDIVDYAGNELQSFDLCHMVQPRSLHHDFVPTGENELFVLTGKIVAYRQPWSWSRFWRIPLRKIFFENQFVTTVGLKERRVGKSQRIGRRDNPFDEPDWREARRQVARVMAGGGPTSKVIDYTHANSLERSADGFLVSLNAQDRIAFLADAGPEASWSIGASEANTFSTANAPFRFHAQHHVSTLSDGTILLLDNLGDKASSRLLRLSLDRKQRKIALQNAYYPKPPLIVPSRGSAFPLPNGNILGYFPLAPADPCEVDSVVVEFDGSSGAERSRLSVGELGTPFSGYRALPMEALGDSTYLGPTL